MLVGVMEYKFMVKLTGSEEEKELARLFEKLLDDEGLALRDENACFGCGVCSRFCQEEAISLREGLRRVFIMPPRMRTAG
jgi:ferredoxin